MFMNVYTKAACGKTEWSKVCPLNFHRLGLTLSWCRHLPAVCSGTSYQACWAPAFLFVTWHNQVYGRHSWLAMQNPFSSCFFTNRVTNLLRFWAPLRAGKSGPLLSLRRQILIRWSQSREFYSLWELLVEDWTCQEVMRRIRGADSGNLPSFLKCLLKFSLFCPLDCEAQGSYCHLETLSW